MSESTAASDELHERILRAVRDDPGPYLPGIERIAAALGLPASALTEAIDALVSSLRLKAAAMKVGPEPVGYRATETEGHPTCGRCRQKVGTFFDGHVIPYVRLRLIDSAGNESASVACADEAACDRRWDAANEPDPWAEDDPNEEADDINDVGDIEDEEPT